MKKSRILGYALTLAATLFVGSAMGQTDVEGGSKYEKITGTLGEANEFSLVQKGLTYGFYVKPSDIHSSYNTAGSFQIADGFSWTWTATNATGVPGTALIANGKKSSEVGFVRANYVELSYANAGEYTVKVVENAPSTWGSCSGSETSFKVYAFDAPSFVMGTGPNTSGDPKPTCAAAAIPNVDFTAVIKSSGTAWVKYRLEKWSVKVDGTSGKITPDTKLSSVDAAEAKFATATRWNWDVKTSATAITDGIASMTVKTELVATATPKLAEYDFKLTKTLPLPDAATTPAEKNLIVYRMYIDGVNGLFSRKADFYKQVDGSDLTPIAPATGYYDTANTASFDYYVSVAPKTGPVYHIGNNVAK